MINPPTLCLIIPTYNRPGALLKMLHCLNDNINFLEGVAVFINSSSDDGSDEYVKELISSFNQELNMTFITSKKAGLSAAVRESLLLAPGVYKAVIADDYIIYPNNIPKIISELRRFKPLFYRSYFSGYHSHRQATCRVYSKPESILFAAQHLGCIYANEALEILSNNDALCFRSEHGESKELAWIHRVYWLNSIIAELLFVAADRYPSRFVSSGTPLLGFSNDNYPSEQAKITTHPYWHAAFFSEETWSVIALINKLAEKYRSVYNERLRTRLINSYIFDSVMRTFNFYVSSGLYKKGSLFSRVKKVLKIVKYF
jgi:glycosyltransferase involved in cell wall biosynthesis